MSESFPENRNMNVNLSGTEQRSVSFFTLGCKVNQYETEQIREQFEKKGYRIAAEDESADIYVINTCTVTNMSDRKSRQHIRSVRRKNPSAVIVVTGCYAQIKPDEAAAVPGVCIVAGTNEKGRIADLVENYIDNNDFGKTYTSVLSYDEINEYEDLGNISAMGDHTRAFIKVQEGCDRFCSYCIIPFARGKARSRSLEDIVDEAAELVRNGFREIVLTGINTALYGVDFKESGGRSGIEKLVSEISGIEGDFRIRLSSVEPNVIDVKMAEALLQYKKLCPHMHLSLQSGSDSVLKRMNRRYDSSTYCAIVDALRKSDPCYAVTTDIITGFPGETEAEFKESLDLIDRLEFLKVHAFRYSRRSGTLAADMPDQIPPAVKTERMERLHKAGERSAARFMQKNTGTVRRVLFERVSQDGKSAEGYTDNYIRVVCECGHLTDLTGNFYDVCLNSVGEGYMKGTIINTRKA